jgi:hypothetical protein
VNKPIQKKPTACDFIMDELERAIAAFKGKQQGLRTPVTTHQVAGGPTILGFTFDFASSTANFATIIVLIRVLCAAVKISGRTKVLTRLSQMIEAHRNNQIISEYLGAALNLIAAGYRPDDEPIPMKARPKDHICRSSGTSHPYCSVCGKLVGGF